MIDWSETKDFIRAHGRFVITTHVYPEGDAIGSEIALAALLRTLGKEARILNDHPVPRIYRFLDPAGRCLVHDEALIQATLRWCDALIIVDVGVWSRVGRPAEAMKSSGRPSLCIDHHLNNERIGSVNVVDDSYCAAGELVFELGRALGASVDRETAAALFAAIATDTGWFRFTNTSARCLAACSELMLLEADPARLYALIYESLRPERMRLLALTLGTLSLEAGGRIAWCRITQPMFRESGADEEDVEGIVDIIRCIGGVEVVLLFRERAEGGTKVSLRAKGEADVNAVARQFDGGGHARAAGIRSSRPMDEMIQSVVAAVRDALA